MEAHMKRFAWLLLALPLLGACSGPAKKADALDSIKKAGKLVIGTSADFPPYEFHIQDNGTDKIVGFDIAVGQEIAKDLGVTLEIKDMKFDGLLAALDSGNVDIVLAGMSPTDERKKTTDFSEIYYRAEQGVIVRAADKDKYTTPESLKNAMIGAQKGAIQVGIAKKQIKGMKDDTQDNAQVKELPKLGDLVLSLKNKNIDAIVVETGVAKAYVAANPDLVVAPFIFPDESGGSAIAIKKGNSSLLEAVNKTLVRLGSANAVEGFVTDANSLMEKL
jgi:arginine/lysine/histidine transporter system substrate-binding protein